MGMVAHSSATDCHQILARSWHPESLERSLMRKARISLTQASDPIPSVEKEVQAGLTMNIIIGFVIICGCIIGSFMANTAARRSRLTHVLQSTRSSKT
ncbi:hypothetical protein [Rhizobium sp. AN80A]|uniref:hypothetical protein n=1 Tax=Rhizobium sp. AN80A TaxID=3040673 RepID=UPI0024B3BD66|nr:hypothetical protein [Rhizobium sp. AN80A]